MDEIREKPVFKAGLVEKSDIVKGYFSDISHFEEDPRWLVKEYCQVNDDTYAYWLGREKTRGADAEPMPEMTWRRFSMEVGKSSKLLKEMGGGFKKYMPEHHLVFGQNKAGEKRGFVVMKKVIGKDIVSMEKGEVGREMMDQLEDLIRESVEFFYRTTKGKFYLGYFPDLTPPQKDKEVRLGNMMWGVVEGKKGLYHIDTYPLDDIFSEHILAESLKKAMERFEEEKGVKFSDGFIENISRRILDVKKNK